MGKSTINGQFNSFLYPKGSCWSMANFSPNRQRQSRWSIAPGWKGSCALGMGSFVQGLKSKATEFWLILKSFDRCWPLLIGVDYHSSNMFRCLFLPLRGMLAYFEICHVSFSHFFLMCSSSSRSPCECSTFCMLHHVGRPSHIQTKHIVFSRCECRCWMVLVDLGNDVSLYFMNWHSLAFYNVRNS